MKSHVVRSAPPESRSGLVVTVHVHAGHERRSFCWSYRGRVKADLVWFITDLCWLIDGSSTMFYCIHSKTNKNNTVNGVYRWPGHEPNGRIFDRLMDGEGRLAIANQFLV